MHTQIKRKWSIYFYIKIYYKDIAFLTMKMLKIIFKDGIFEVIYSKIATATT